VIDVQNGRYFSEPGSEDRKSAERYIGVLEPGEPEPLMTLLLF